MSYQAFGNFTAFQTITLQEYEALAGRQFVTDVSVKLVVFMWK